MSKESQDRNCEVCSEAAGSKFRLYQDEDIVLFLSRKGIAGTIIAAPRKHYVILEQVPDEIFEKCFWMANRISSIMFETLKCKGTNIIINNGDGAGQAEPHFCVYIIPRYENDSVSLSWNPQSVTQEMLSEARHQLAGQFTAETGEKPKPVPEKKPEEPKPEQESRPQENPEMDEQEEKKPEPGFPKELLRIP